MPKFFRRAADQLSYLGPEPDRWRDAEEAKRATTMRDAFNPDHFINFERIPETAWSAPDRFAFLAEMRKVGMDLPEAGLSPYRIVEMFQRLRVEFRLWRKAPNRRIREWIEQRIINDAGLLAHYVTDGANPLHTSIHHHGWIGDNPSHYATDREIHARFEGLYVSARMTLSDLQPRVDGVPRTIRDIWPDVLKYLKESHTEVATLYQIDQRAPFNETTTAAENSRFVLERLAFGSRMLRDLWWTAWVTSVE